MARMCVILFALATVVNAQFGYDVPSPPSPPPSGYSYNTPEIRSDESSFDQQVDPLAMLKMNIPGGGVPGESFPILSTVPDTGFDCRNQDYAGYFADTAEESGCQVFHICQFDGHQDSFLCPNGTIFNQQYFVCDWWFNVDCSSTEQFLRLNEAIGVAPEMADASFRDDVVVPDQLYSAPDTRQADQPYGTQEIRQVDQLYVTPEIRQVAPPAPTEPTRLYNVPNGF